MHCSAYWDNKVLHKRRSGYTCHGHSLLGNCGQNEFSAFSFWIQSVQSYHQMADSRHRAASLAYNLYDIETWCVRRHAEIRSCGNLGNNWTDNKLVREKRLGRTSKLFIVYAWKLSIHISAHCRSCHSADAENLKLKTNGLKNFRIDDRWYRYIHFCSIIDWYISICTCNVCIW